MAEPVKLKKTLTGYFLDKHIENYFEQNDVTTDYNTLHTFNLMLFIEADYTIAAA